jgi:hypothetical protein
VIAYEFVIKPILVRVCGERYLAMNYNNSLSLEWAAEVGLQRQLMNATGVPVRTSLVSGGVHLLGVGRKQDERLETAAAFPAVPNMTGAPIAPVLGPFGGDQLITALNAFHPEAGTTTGNARPHHSLRASAFT